MTKITLNHITKVEGHANLSVEIENGKLKTCDLGAVEGARFFEGLVVGRKYDEIKEITTRICGICSVGHSMTSLKATEKAFNIEVSEQTKILREIMTMGERIRSHATHLYFLTLPDFLGYESAIEMAPKYQTEIQRALDLMKVGNDIVTAIGGRQMHPVSSVVGGFTSIPSAEKIAELIDMLESNRKSAMETLKLFSSLSYPDLIMETEHLSLFGSGLPLLEGSIISDRKLKTTADKYKEFLTETIETRSTAKFAVKDGKGYLTGAIARLNLNWDEIGYDIKQILSENKILFPTKNIFHNNVAQAVELVYWIDKVKELLETNEFKQEEIIQPTKLTGKGIAATEVPRGILFHEYHFENGYVTYCNIITPTVQNLRSMEDHIRIYVNQLLNENKEKDEITFEIEKLIRAYDPCFSCSAHFLKINWKES